MEFDFRLDEASDKYTYQFAGANTSNRTATIEVKRRKKKEIDLRSMLDE
jgi:hypothetical protein